MTGPQWGLENGVSALYSQIVKDHALNPRNRREMKDPDLLGQGKFPRCGDKVKIYLRLQGQSIVDASFTASACGPAVAAASLATTLVLGLTLEAAKLAVISELPRVLIDLPASKRHAILIVFECIAQILEQSQTNQTQENNSMPKRYAHLSSEGDFQFSPPQQKTEQAAAERTSPIVDLAKRVLSEKLKDKPQRQPHDEPRSHFGHLVGEPSWQKRIENDSALAAKLQTKIQQRKGGQ